MVRASVNVNFEAADRAEVEELLDGWKLHEGCQVFVSVQESVDPLEADSAGKLARSRRRSRRPHSRATASRRSRPRPSRPSCAVGCAPCPSWTKT